MWIMTGVVRRGQLCKDGWGSGIVPRQEAAGAKALRQAQTGYV